MNKNHKPLINCRHIHFIGIGGIGMSGLAELMLRYGYQVSGSDIRQTPILERLSDLGVTIFQNQKPGNNGEIHITDAIRTLIKKKNKFIGHVFAGKYLDCGTMKGYINSTLEISKNNI